MEDYAFIPSLGMTPAEFWAKANHFGRTNRVDGILAYMYTMLRESAARKLPFTRADLVEMGRGIVLFPGVEDWFQRINAFGRSQGVTGLSDVPCMKMLRSSGGQAIAVYQESNRVGVEDLLAKGRVDFIFPADYSQGTTLEAAVQDIIRKMAVCDRLFERNVSQLRSIGGDVLPNQVGLF